MARGADTTTWPSRTKVVDHPEVGRITLDCGVPAPSPTRARRSPVYSAEPGTEDADKLELLRVLGTQAMSQR